MPTDNGSHPQDGKTAGFDNKKQYQALTSSFTYVAMST